MCKARKYAQVRVFGPISMQLGILSTFVTVSVNNSLYLNSLSFAVVDQAHFDG